MSKGAPAKDPDAVENYYFVWCDETGLNDGSKSDNGELQGATISTIAVSADTGLTAGTSTKPAVTIHGVSYVINTVVTCPLSGGTAGESYNVRCRITTSDGRTLDQTMSVPVLNL